MNAWQWVQAAWTLAQGAMIVATFVGVAVALAREPRPTQEELDRLIYRS